MNSVPQTAATTLSGVNGATNTEGADFRCCQNFTFRHGSFWDFYVFILNIIFLIAPKFLESDEQLSCVMLLKVL